MAAAMFLRGIDNPINPKQQSGNGRVECAGVEPGLSVSSGTGTCLGTLPVHMFHVEGLDYRGLLESLKNR